MIIFLFFALPLSYGNGGPAPLSPEKAQNIAQDYLDSQNWPYVAKKSDPLKGDGEMKIKVKMIKTGKTAWVSDASYMRDIDMDTGIGTKYESLPGYNYAYIVKIYDKNGKYKGNIYVNAKSGAIKMVNVNKPVDNTDTSNNTTINNTNNMNITEKKPDGILEAFMNLINSIMAFFANFMNNSSIYQIGNSEFKLGSEWEPKNNETRNETENSYSRNFILKNDDTVQFWITQYGNKEAYDAKYKENNFSANGSYRGVSWQSDMININGTNVKKESTSGITTGSLLEINFYYFEKNGKYYTIDFFSKGDYSIEKEKALNMTVSSIK